MSDSINLPGKFFRDLAEKVLAQHEFSKSQLATNIVKLLDVGQDSADMAGRKVDIGLDGDYKHWNNIVLYMSIRNKLWSTFGEGEECYNDLMNQCKERGYSQLYANGALNHIAESIKDAPHEEAD